MSASIEYLTDKENNIILPKTVTKAITDENGNRLDKVLGQPNMDMVMLGWSVPIDCPIKNYVDDNRVFHQLVGRVKVSDCIITLYNVSEGKLFRTIIRDIKQATTSTYIPKVYLNGYITTSMSTRKDKTISQAPINDAVDILDNSYADATAFKNAMLQQNAYVYYELDKEITFPIDGHEQYNRTNDLKMLGWTVPTECPIQNYTDSNGIYHQRVVRVDISTLKFGLSSGGLFNVGLTPSPKGTASATSQINYMINGYTAVAMQSTSVMNDKTFQIRTNGMIYLKDSSYSDVTAFKNAKKGVYLYYELETEILIPIDGNEATTNQIISDEWLSNKTYSLGDFCIYKNKLWKSKVANNTGNIPEEGTYWKATNVGNEIKGEDIVRITPNLHYIKINPNLVQVVCYGQESGNYTLPFRSKAFACIPTMRGTTVTGFIQAFEGSNRLEIGGTTGYASIMFNILDE